MNTTLTYREEKQQKWEKMIKKHRLTFVTQGDDFLHDFLDRLRPECALKGKEDYRVYFQDGDDRIQFQIEYQYPNQIWMYKCVKGKFVADEVLASYLEGLFNIWYEKERKIRVDLHDFFRDLQVFMYELAEEENPQVCDE